jgi:uroporphyrinogen-III decarboxylase
MAFMGGLDKLILPEGKQAIDHELESKIPAMLELGGYLPSLDHRVVVETSLLQFGYYVKRVRELMGQEELAANIPHSNL